MPPAMARSAVQSPEVLQRVMERLLSALTPAAVGEVVIGEVHELLGATASVAYFAAEDGVLRLAASCGVAPDEASRFSVLPPDAPLPLAAAMRTREAVWLMDRESWLRT